MPNNKANILVVDDRAEGILAVSAVLDSPDYNLITANSGNEALKHLLKYDFAVILLDVQMPIMNGFELAAIIKTRSASKDIPIIFMSAINQDEQYVYQGYEAGAVDYLLKPFDPYILRSKVAIFVDIFNKKILIQEQAQKLFKVELQAHTVALEKNEIESLRRYQYLADSIPQIVFRLSPDGAYDYFNKTWFEYTGLSINKSFGMSWKEVIHPEDLHTLTDLFESTINVDGREIECRILNRHGQFHWHLLKIQPESHFQTHEIISWLGTATDIEDRKNMEVSQRFLSEAGEILVTSLDPEVTLLSICKLSIPYLADWAAFDLVNQNKGLSTFAFHHRNPEKNEIYRHQHVQYLDSTEGKYLMNSVLETGKTKIQNKISSDLNYTGTDIEQAFDQSQTSLIIFPLIAHGHKFGTLTFASSGTRKYDSFYIELGEELTRRIALSFANSQLYQISQEAIEVRNDFLSIASHELNTPITSLKFQLQILQKLIRKSEGSPLPLDKFTKSLNGSVKQVDRLINLVQVLLDVSYIQSGKFLFTFEEFNLSDVLHEVTERHKEILDQSHCQLVVKSPENLMVFWDKTRVEQIFVNLLTNAIKYAPGKIEISIIEELDSVKINVADSGKGIPPDKLNLIFERFERATSNLNVSGLGLGLFIVKQIVEGHKGSIEVKSELNLGTCFSLTLPKSATQLPAH